MTIEFLELTAILVVVCAIAVGVTYGYFRKGIALYLVTLAAELSISSGLICYVIGVNGLFSIWTLLGVLVITPLNTVTLVLIFRKIILPLRQISAHIARLASADLPELQLGLQSVAEGDLTAHLHFDLPAVAQNSWGEVKELQQTYQQMISCIDTAGSTFEEMIHQLRHMLGSVDQVSGQLNTASYALAEASNQASQAVNQIAGTIQQVAAGANQQSEAINASAESIDQMARAIAGLSQSFTGQSDELKQVSGFTQKISLAVQTVTNSTRTGAESTGQAAKNAHDSARIVGDTIQGMRVIQSRVGESAAKVQEMGVHSGQIGLIVETIEEIATQTNLLALNAAIEAARAGAAGKGFAVVADEVRKLAERSAAATREIGGLVRSIQTSVSEAMKAMQTSAQEVESGVARAGQADNALSAILSAVEQVSQTMQAIASTTQRVGSSANDLVDAVDRLSSTTEMNLAAVEEITASSDEVRSSSETIASVSEENSASVEEVSAGTEELTAQVVEMSASAQKLADMAGELRQVLDYFKLDETRAPVAHSKPGDRRKK